MHQEDLKDGNNILVSFKKNENSSTNDILIFSIFFFSIKKAQVQPIVSQIPLMVAVGKLISLYYKSNYLLFKVIMNMITKDNHFIHHGQISLQILKVNVVSLMIIGTLNF